MFSQPFYYLGIEKSQLSKQKSNGSKRGDKKNFKVPSKVKFDSSSMKLGAAIFNSACGGNNFFGIFLLGIVLLHK